MADSSVLLEVIVEGKNIKLVQRDVEELGSSINKASDAQGKQEKQQKKNKKSTKELNNETKNYNRGQKGVAGATANGTKAFSKQRDAIGGGSSGLVGAYATLAANLFAATALFGALRSAAQVETLVAGAEALGAASGRNIPLLAESLKEATANAISLDQALRTASFATSSGFSGQQIESLAEVGKKAAIALGRDVGDAVDRLTRGVAKLEPEILDELGIIVRLDDATEAYAAQIGKTVSQLTAFERQQAFANATIEQGLNKFSNIDVDPNPYDKLASSLRDIANAGLALINTVLGPLVGFFADNKAALVALVVVLTKGIVNQALPVFSQFAQRAREAAGEVARASSKAAKAQKKAFRASKEALSEIPEEMSKVAKEYAVLPKQAKSYDDLIEQEKKLAETIERRTRALKNANRTPEGIEKSKGEIAELTDLQSRLNNEISKSKAPEIDPALADNLKKLADKRADIFESLDENPSFGNFIEKFKEGRKVGKEYASTMDEAGKFNTVFAKKLPILGTKLQFLDKGFKLAAVSTTGWGLATQVAIRGVTYAIPIIGQILFVITLLIAGIKGLINIISDLLPEQSALGKAADAVSASTDTLKSSTKAYAKELVELDRETALFAGTRANFIDEEERAIEVSKMREKRLDAEIQFIVAQGTALDETIKSYETYRDELAKANESSGILTRAVRALGDAASSIGLRFSRMGMLIKLAIKDAIVGLNTAIADAVENGGFLGEIFGKVFGIGASEIAATRREAQNLDEQLQRTFAAKDADVFISTLNSKLSETFLNTIEGSQAAAQGLTNTLFAVGDDIDTQRISQGISQIFDNIDTAEVNDEVKEIARGFAGANGLLDEQAEREAFILALLKEGTQEVRDQATSINNINSAIDGSAEALSNFITGYSKAKSSVGSVLEQTEKLTSEFQNSTVDVALLERLSSKLPAGFKGVLEQVEGANGSLVEGLQIYEGMLKNLQNIELSIKRTTSLEKEKVATLKLAGKLNRVAAANTITSELEVIKLNKRKKDQEIELLELEVQRQRLLFEEAQRKAADEGKELQVPQALLQVEQNLADLRAESASLQRQKVSKEAEYLNIALMTLDIQKEQAGIDQERAKITEQQTVQAQKLANALSGRGFKLTEAQELQQIERQGNLAIEAAKTEFDIAKARLAIERSILEAKLTAAQAQIDTFNADPANAGNQIANIDQTGILSDFDMNTTRALEGLQNKIDAATVNLQGSLLEAAFGGMGGQAGDNPATQAFDGMQGALERFRVLKEQIGEDATPFETLKLQFMGVRDAIAPSLDALRQLGPEGVLLAAVGEGVMSMGENFAILGQKAEEGADKYETMATKIAAVGGIINSIGQIAAAASQQRIAAIDAEIAAEKKRDGKSKESLARIQQLEKKKEAAKKKQFEMDKKMQMANVVINTATAIMGIWSGVKDPYVGPISAGAMTAIVAGLGAAQLALIASTSYQGGGGSIGGQSTPTSISAGQRKSSVDLAKSQSSAGELAYMRGYDGIGGPENFKPAMMGAKYRAMGGPTTGYVVGEQGPELFVPNTPGTIVPNNSAPEMQQPLNVNFSINTIDASGVEDLLVQQQGNIIGMVRSAANSYGQPFLEQVDTASFTQAAGGATKY